MKKRRHGEALVVEPGVGGKEERCEHERAGVGDPIPPSAAAPEVNDGPRTAEGGRQSLEPDVARRQPVAEEGGKAGNEVIFDGRGAHHDEVIAPGARVDERDGETTDGECGNRAGKKLITARDHDPYGERGSKGEKQVRLEGAEPERRAGGERAAQMKAKEENQADESKKRCLTYGDADDAGSECKAKPMEVVRRGTVQLVNNAHSEEKAGEQEQRPEDAGEAEAQQPNRQSERECPGRVAHEQDGPGIEALRVLERSDGVTIIGVAVVKEETASGPIGDKVARGVQLQVSGDGNGADVKDCDSESDAGDGGNGDLRKVTAFLRGDLQLASHAGNSTGATARQSA